MHICKENPCLLQNKEYSDFLSNGFSVSYTKEMKYIGERQIKSHKQTKETTPGGTPIIEVKYEGGLVEHLSKIMFDKIISEESCDLNKLREKRVFPVMEQVLMILREWGIKSNEFPYFSELLNVSLDRNRDAAYIKLISQYMPKPLSLEDVDLITLDRILRSEDK